MLIKCAICGERDVSEFSYLGDAGKVRPDAYNKNPETDLSIWHDYVFARENPRGLHEEHWQHSGGCRAILRVKRNVTSHEIFEVSLVGPHGGGAS